MSETSALPRLPTERPPTSGVRVGIAPGACLEMRLARDAHEHCGLCIPACPRGTLVFSHRQPVAGNDCIGCGQCAAVCPTGALTVDGFALAAELPEKAPAIHVDCWRVDREDSPDGSLRVPCLGGIDQGWLLALAARAGGRPLHLIDRGACDTCLAGAGIAAFHAMLAETRQLLAACRLPAEALPASVKCSPRRPLAPAIPTTAEVQPVSRRGFFRSLAGSAVRTAEAPGMPTPPPRLSDATIAPMQRLRTITALQQIAGRNGLPVPASVLPRLTLAACDGHGVCAHVCPTGALRRIEGDDGAALIFHSSLCIACGHCAASCPERAIRVLAEGGDMQPVVLAHWARQRCEECGEDFFGGGASCCPSCLKKANLQQGLAALFRLPA